MKRFALALGLLFAPAALARDQVCFTPGQDCTGLIVRQIAASQQQILVQAYSFTSRPIMTALIDAHSRGVDVQVILDKAHTGAARDLFQAGIPVRVDHAHAIAHNKVMIFDRQRILTGSFNFTAAAQSRNAENLIIIEDMAVVSAYAANFQHHANHSN